MPWWKPSGTLQIWYNYYQGKHRNILLPFMFVMLGWSNTLTDTQKCTKSNVISQSKNVCRTFINLAYVTTNMESHTEKGGRTWRQNPTWALGEKLSAFFQAASDFQCIAFQERALEHRREKIISLIPLCERHALEFRRLTDWQLLNLLQFEHLG